MPHAPTLARLIAPASLDAFANEHWGRRSLHVRGAADRFEDLRPADWEAWVHAAEPVDAARRDPAGRQVQTRIPPARAREMFDAGMTICADVSRQPTVAALLSGLAGDLRPFRGAAFAKLYVSPAHAGFAPHFDGHHVFVVQLAGRKRWHYGRTPVTEGSLDGGKLDAHSRPVHTYPRDGLPVLDAEGAPIDAPDFAREETTVLAPGDVLYIPPGTWHTTEAVETSIALSISPPRAPMVELVLDALRERLLADPRLYQDIVAIEQADGRGPPLAVERAARFALGRLQSVASELTATDLHLHWGRATFAGEPNLASSEPATLVPDDALAAAPGGFVFMRARDPGTDAEALFVLHPGVELVLPLAAERLVQRLHAAAPITVAEAIALQSAWPAEDTVELLTALLEAGVLRRISAA